MSGCRFPDDEQRHENRLLFSYDDGEKCIKFRNDIMRMCDEVCNYHNKSSKHILIQSQLNGFGNVRRVIGLSY